MSTAEFTPNHVPPTTREVVTREAAATWLQHHPDVTPTLNDLAKTAQQLITHIFQTGHQRRTAPLSEHALDVLAQAEVSEPVFRSIRALPIRADLPAGHAAAFSAIGEVLFPLAAAIQSARIPLTNAAKYLAGERGLLATGLLDRKDLRGFVVACLVPYAQAIHARVGSGYGATDYLALILADTDVLATQIVDAAVAKRTATQVLDQVAEERLDAYSTVHLARLRTAAHRTYGYHDGEEILADAMEKLSVAFRNNPDLDIDYAYGHTTLTNTTKSYKRAAGVRSGREVTSSEVIELFAPADDNTRAVALGDFILRRVLSAADTLGESTIERSLARQTLVRFFLVDPTITDPRRARLTPRALTLSAPDEVADYLRTIAAELAQTRAAATRITKLAITALHTQQAA